MKSPLFGDFLVLGEILFGEVDINNYIQVIEI
jgi:hypothetical protein